MAKTTERAKNAKKEGDRPRGKAAKKSVDVKDLPPQDLAKKGATRRIVNKRVLASVVGGGSLGLRRDDDSGGQIAKAKNKATSAKKPVAVKNLAPKDPKSTKRVAAARRRVV